MMRMAAPDTPHINDQRTQFADLIRESRAALGLSLVDFAARATDPDTGEQVVKSGWIHRLEKGDSVIPPQLPQLRALARATGKPLEVLQDAAGQQFFGVDPIPSESGHARALVQRADRMTPQQFEQLMRFLDTFLPAEGEGD
jgi:transcriptional regulator with XRE-family HTH domain